MPGNGSWCAFVRWRGQASGAPVEWDFGFLFEMRGGRVAKVSFYIRRDDALGAAGLRE
jgi:ketosteroid isomerase-like protein